MPNICSKYSETLGKYLKENLTNSNLTETFDLTGKSNPQYRRYSDWGKFLKNKYGGKEITDKQGNTWVEIDLKPEYKRMPIEAFGAFAIPSIFGERKQKDRQKKSFLERLIPSREITIEKLDNSQQLKNAIASSETGILPENKRYSFSKKSGISIFGRDLGKYQITEGELASYSKRYLGRKILPKEFLANPALQEKYMDNKIKYLRSKKYSDEEIIAIHRGGMNYKANSKTIKEYVKKTMEQL